MPAPRIFLSHSHADNARCEVRRRAAGDGLSRLGDRNNAQQGHFRRRSSSASCSSWVVLVLTKDALASPWVKQEMRRTGLMARDPSRLLLPVKIGPWPCRLPPAALGALLVFDATLDYRRPRARRARCSGSCTAAAPP